LLGFGSPTGLFFYYQPMREFFRQLRERHVVKIAIAYLVAAWVVLQLADVIFPAMNLPDWSITLALGLLACGFPIALMLAWVFDLTPGGVERTKHSGGLLVVDSIGDKTSNQNAIAVLPFPDMSAEKDQEYFCDGLTDELINVLTRIPNLRVASRTSCFAFKGKETNMAEVAEKLRVAHILEGSVRKSGNQIRVTAQLIEVRSDSHAWSETYDRELSDIFKIQDDIAAHVLASLKIRLGEHRLPDPTTQNVKAYEYYLRARGHAITRKENDIERAIDLFHKALEADNKFVRGWISLAEASAFQAIYIPKHANSRQLAIDAGKEAMRLAPERAGSHMARGFGRLANGQYAEAEKDFLQALVLDPTQLDAYHYLARAAQHQGENDRALQYYSRATDLNSDDFESPLIALSFYSDSRNSDAAQRFAQIGVQRAERHLEDYPDNPRAYYLGIGGLAVLGDMERAQRWADRVIALAPNDPSTRYNLACFYSTIGETEKALDLLEDSIHSRNWIENDPELEPLRKFPRYQSIIASLPD